MNDSLPKKRPWLRILLGLSLALNLLIVGVVLGSAWRFHGRDGMRHPPSFGAALFRALPEADRKALHKQMRSEREHRFGKRSRDILSLSEALRVAPFDPLLIEKMVVNYSQARADLLLSMNAAWLARVSQMSDDERQQYADRLEELTLKSRRHSHKQR